MRMPKATWRLASNELVHYRHQLMWSVDPDIYPILIFKKATISFSELLFLLNYEIVFEIPFFLTFVSTFPQ